MIRSLAASGTERKDGLRHKKGRINKIEAVKHGLTTPHPGLPASFLLLPAVTEGLGVDMERWVKPKEEASALNSTASVSSPELGINRFAHVLEKL